MSTNYEQRLLRQGASWAAPPQDLAYKATLAQLRTAELATRDVERILSKAMACQRRNTAGVKLLALLAGRLQRAKALERGLRGTLQG